MTPEEQTKLAATIGAHEQILTILFADYLNRLPHDRREAIALALTNPQSSPAPVNLTDDIDTADQIAGMLMSHKEAVARIVQSALRRAPKGP